MKKIPFSSLVFDRGHGEANYEMLRISIDKGKGPLGASATGLKHLLPSMLSVDMGGSSEIIDRVTGTTSKALTKNVIVKSAQLLNEENRLVIPACNKKGETVENDELNLIGQMRGYVVARYGKSGEIYESTVRDGLDHRLDAMMLAIHGYMLDTSQFHKWNSDISVEQSDSVLSTNVKPGWRSKFKEQLLPSVEKRNGITIYRHGNHSNPGEPGEYTRDKDGNLIRVGKKVQNDIKTFKHRERTLIKKPKRGF